MYPILLLWTLQYHVDVSGAGAGLYINGGCRLQQQQVKCIHIEGIKPLSSA